MRELAEVNLTSGLLSDDSLVALEKHILGKFTAELSDNNDGHSDNDETEPDKDALNGKNPPKDDKVGGDECKSVDAEKPFEPKSNLGRSSPKHLGDDATKAADPVASEDMKTVEAPAKDGLCGAAVESTNLEASTADPKEVLMKENFQKGAAVSTHQTEPQLTSQDDDDQLLFLDEWLNSHIKDAETIIQKPLLFAEFGKSSKDPRYDAHKRDELFSAVYSRKDERNADDAITERLAKKLDLQTTAKLKTEATAVRKLVKAKGKSVTQQVVDLLAKFKQIAGVDENSVLDKPALSNQSGIMADLVIISTGHTYERESIHKWLNSGHRTCPKMGQTLNHSTVDSNFTLRNLIQQWCEKNNYELPKKEVCDNPVIAASPLAEELTRIKNLIAVRIRMLSKESPDSRILIANNGGIPPLVYLLSYTDSETQQHIVTALLNLSLDEANKRLIAIPAIIQVLRYGTEEAKENSAAALFSLSTLDENKVLVGCSNGIPQLVDLLQTGTSRGEKDAATTLFSLVLNQANRSRAIKAGIIPPLLHLLEDKTLDMVDEALSILLLIASHPEGRNEIGKMTSIQTLVEIVRDGTPKNKECATALILELGSNNSFCLLGALQYGRNVGRGSSLNGGRAAGLGHGGLAKGARRRARWSTEG
ncbi:hypothetical protein ACS0TY_034097 [Phlomoides rotata]